MQKIIKQFLALFYFGKGGDLQYDGPCYALYSFTLSCVCCCQPELNVHIDYFVAV